MATDLAERLVTRLATIGRRSRGPNRRGFLGGAALVGAALTVDPWGYLTRPADAYSTVCGSDSNCADGYTVFCCTINAGANSCPPDSFIGGWWKADNSSFCGGSARYYIDCNAYRDGHYKCHCNTTTCDQRRVACNQFRYGQCNTQIPMSQTGPVLCRVVSCTPPWVQYGSTCSSSSATDNQTASHTAPCVAQQNPIGVLEHVTVSGNTVHLVGWVYDPDQPATSINVAVYQDGHGLSVQSAAVARPDVNSAKHITGRHGFSISLTASTGNHTYRVYGINVGSGTNALIGTKTVAVNPGARPVAHLDALTVSGNTVRARGWAYDPDRPGDAIGVDIYQDGHNIRHLTTTVNRPDVNRAYRLTGTHGFDVSFPAPSGRHNYRLYAINVGGGAGNPLFVNRDLIVNPGANPTGHLDSVTAGRGSVRIRGWAYDPDQPATSINVAVYQDGHGLRWYTADQARPDVNAARRISGRHGFDITVPVAAGRHTFAVYGINIAGGSGNPRLGQTTVTVAP